MNIKIKIEDICNNIIPNHKYMEEKGRYPLFDDSYYNVDEYISKAFEECHFEAHKKYVDIQYILEGEELIYTSDIKNMEILEPYSNDKDVAFYTNPDIFECHHLKSGDCIVLYPQVAHKPSVRVLESTPVKKIVFKVRIDEEN